MNSTIKSLFSVFIIALLIGCVNRTTPGVDGKGDTSQSFKPDANVNIKHFSSDEDLRAFLSTHTETGSITYNRYGNMDVEVGSSAAMKTDAIAPAGPGFSQTNNQVANVDEADSIKTDGKYIYTITRNALFIVKAGEDAQVVKTIAFNSTPRGLFIEGNHLAVFGNLYGLDYFKSIDYVPRNGMTFFTVYDISDVQNPTIVKDYKFEGNYFEARLYKSNVYFAVISTPDLNYPTPIIIENGIKRSMAASDIAYFPIPYDSVKYLTVHAFSLTSPGDMHSKSVAVQWDNKMYMSEKNIYVTYTEHINQWEIRQNIAQELIDPQLTTSDRSLIQEIKNINNNVLSASEKKGKIYQIYATYEQYMPEKERQDFEKQVDEKVKYELDKYESLTYTVIARLGADNGNVNVEATGKVPGTINNQFNMDEYKDVLRIATTIQPQWWGRPMRGIAIDVTANAAAIPIAPNGEDHNAMPPQSTNNVYTLDMNLDILGKLTNIAPDETIQSARFIADRLYLVTFKQVDPFFVIDLSDPAHIKELGHLKVPGFSRYLHPYDEHTIIGIGRDATSTGRQQGLKIALYDVTDVENPKELAKFVTNEKYAQSTAEYEHKAFLFDKEKELLVIPAYSYSYNNAYNTGTQDYNGAMVFKINKNEVALRGIIDHSNGQQNWQPMVERSLWIDDLLYTKSPNLLRVNKIVDLSSVKKVELKPAETSQYVIY